jgi:hypothetical protein
VGPFSVGAEDISIVGELVSDGADESVGASDSDGDGAVVAVGAGEIVGGQSGWEVSMCMLHTQAITTTKRFWFSAFIFVKLGYQYGVPEGWRLRSLLSLLRLQSIFN